VVCEGQISADDPRAPDVRALLERHMAAMLAATPPEHAFALDVAGLLDPAISFFSFRAGGELLGVGAIKRLDAGHAEIKSMHTAAAARGRGVGRAILDHLLRVARSEGLRRVSLETGTMAEFAPARALYESAGFTACGPFGDYQPSDDNCFMTLVLTSDAAIPKVDDVTSSTLLRGRCHIDHVRGGGGGDIFSLLDLGPLLSRAVLLKIVLPGHAAEGVVGDGRGHGS